MQRGKRGCARSKFDGRDDVLRKIERLQIREDNVIGQRSRQCGDLVVMQSNVGEGCREGAQRDREFNQIVELCVSALMKP